MRNIRIDARAAVQHEPPETALGIKVCEIQRTRDRVSGQEEIQAHQHATGPRDTLDLVDRQFEIWEVAQAVADENGVERSVGEWQRAGIAANAALHTALAGKLKHPLRDIQRNGSYARLHTGGKQRKVPGAAGQVEHDSVVRQSGL